MTQDFNPELGQELLDYGADGHPGRGFAGAGAFEDVAGVGQVVFDGSGEIGVAGAGARNGLVLRRVAGFDRHGFGPVLPIGVGDDHGDGGADGVALAHSGDNGDAIRLDLHASAAAVTLLPPPEFMIDRIQRDGYAGRESCEGRHEALAVGLPSRFKAKHVG